MLPAYKHYPDTVSSICFVDRNQGFFGFEAGCCLVVANGALLMISKGSSGMWTQSN